MILPKVLHGNNGRQHTRRAQHSPPAAERSKGLQHHVTRPHLERGSSRASGSMYKPGGFTSSEPANHEIPPLARAASPPSHLQQPQSSNIPTCRCTDVRGGGGKCHGVPPCRCVQSQSHAGCHHHSQEALRRLPACPSPGSHHASPRGSLYTASSAHVQDASLQRSVCYSQNCLRKGLTSKALEARRQHHVTPRTNPLKKMPSSQQETPFHQG